MTTEAQPDIAGIKFVIRVDGTQVHVGVDKKDHDPRLFSYPLEDQPMEDAIGGFMLQAAAAAAHEWEEAPKYPKYTPPKAAKTTTPAKTTGRAATPARATTTPPAENPNRLLF